jgi:hypothetical protein
MSRLCPHNKRKDRCVECGGVGICIHNKRKIVCKICGGSQVCIHNKLKQVCKECKGSLLCEHNKQKRLCIDCNGSAICTHNKIKYNCKECGGSSYCIHKKTKSICKECNGCSICEHNKQKRYCLECMGNGICIHNKIKYKCKECKGSQICIHNKIKYECPDCGGSAICVHNIAKYSCKLCGGKRYCIHKKDMRYCADCGGSKICIAKNDTNCRQIGNKKYNGYCAFCFSHIFPDDPLTLQIYNKSKELKVINYIATKYNGFIHDKCLYVGLEGGCCESKRRIDLRKLINNTMLCIEIDENQHKYYIKQDNENRYNDLYMDFSGKYIFIRYNPDSYIENGVRKNPHFNTRMYELENLINDKILRIINDENIDLLEIYHLYYDL